MADQPLRFAFRVTAPLIPIADWEYTLERTESGCRVEESWTDLRSRPVRFLSTLRTGVMRRAEVNRDGMRRTLTALKTAAEERNNT